MKAIRIQFTNIEPLRISNDNRCQSGQTSTLSYIPASTLRGMVISNTIKNNVFENNKKGILTELYFSNSYLLINDKCCFPSFNGFYEDKIIKEGKKEVDNILISGDFNEGYKRAAIGQCCYLDYDENCIKYTSIEKNSDMRINKEEDKVFRLENIKPGYSFMSLVSSDDDKLLNMVFDCIKNIDYFYLGNSKFKGNGRCKLTSCQIVDDSDFQDNYYDAKDQCYFALISNTCMVNDFGELCGLNLQDLEKMFGVENLRIEIASTSTSVVRGYNNTYGCHTPSISVYEGGSVFKFTYNGTITKEKMKEVCCKGIGIKRQEGMGRAIFIDNYENITFKQKINYDRLYIFGIEKAKEDDEVINNVARTYLKNLLDKEKTKYIKNIVDTKKFESINSSKLGTILSIFLNNSNDFNQLLEKEKEFFDHAIEKEENSRIYNTKGSLKPLKEEIDKLLNNSLLQSLNIKNSKIMNIDINSLLTKDMEYNMKTRLIIDELLYSLKEI